MPEKEVFFLTYELGQINQ